MGLKLQVAFDRGEGVGLGFAVGEEVTVDIEVHLYGGVAHVVLPYGLSGFIALSVSSAAIGPGSSRTRPSFVGANS